LVFVGKQKIGGKKKQRGRRNKERWKKKSKKLTTKKKQSGQMFKLGGFFLFGTRQGTEKIQAPIVASGGKRVTNTALIKKRIRGTTKGTRRALAKKGEKRTEKR